MRVAGRRGRDAPTGRFLEGSSRDPAMASFVGSTTRLVVVGVDIARGALW